MDKIPAARGGGGKSGRAPPPPKPLKDRIRAFWINEGPSILVMAVFFAAVSAVFIERFLCMKFVFSFKLFLAIFQFRIVLFPSDYMNERPDVFSLLGHGVTVARSSGAALKLLGSVILVTMMRNFLSW